MLKHLIAITYTLLSLLWIQQAYAFDSTNAFGQLEYVRHTQLISVEELKTREEQSWQAIKLDEANFGFDQAHYWFRVPIIKGEATKGRWLLRSNYPLLDNIDVYLFVDDVLKQEFHTGDVRPFSQRPLQQPSFVFPLDLNPTQTNWLYIHVYTSSSVQLPLTLQPEIQFWKNLASENAIAAAFYSILLCMLIYNLVIYLIAREKSYLYYILYLASFTTLLASIHGWSYQLLWPNSPLIHQTSVVLSIATTSLFGCLFGVYFLRLKEMRPDLLNIAKVIVWLSLGGIFVAVILPYSIAIKINASLALAVVAFGVYITIQEWIRAHSKEVLIFIISWCTLLLGFTLFIGQKFGALPVNNFTEHAIEIGAVLEVLLLALGLAERINNEKKRRIETQQEMLQVQLKANEKLDQKVRERTEELERMNSLLQLTSVTDALTQVNNRHYFDQKLPGEYLRAYREKTWISLLMLDIDHFKHFNDTHGHQAGDAVLQAVGNTLKNGIKRPSDRVVRYGGEEFVVILPNTTPDGAYRVAERIRKLVSELSIHWQQKDLSVTVSIGSASQIPISREGEKELINKADQYLYTAKDRGRNQVIYDGNLNEKKE